MKHRPPLLAWLGAVCLVAAAAQAQTVADPTRPPTAAAPAASAPARAASAPAPQVLRVQSVQLPREGRASALVDNRLVFVGDKLGAGTVAAIDALGVEFKRADGRSERLRLIDAAIVKQAALAPAPSTAPVASVATAGGPQP
jgi:MSHA biogenesis protein MshK